MSSYIFLEKSRTLFRMDVLGACSMTDSFMLISLWVHKVIYINNSINCHESLGNHWVWSYESLQIPLRLYRKAIYFRIIQAMGRVTLICILKNWFVCFLFSSSFPSSFLSFLYFTTVETSCMKLKHLLNIKQGSEDYFTHKKVIMITF